MYFPYLYARRFELLALRDAATHLNVSKTLVPILEPVTQKPSDLVRCMSELSKGGVRAIVLMNPSQADFKFGIDPNWLKEVRKGIEENAATIPAYSCGPKTALTEIRKFINAHPNRKLALVYSNPKLTDSEIEWLSKLNQIVFHIVMENRLSDAGRAILPPNKTVDVREQFKEAEKNSDYEGVEMFSDRHLTFKKTGVGFGDFSVIGGKYRKGGGQPAAVVIHAIFVGKDNNYLHVEHFVSDDIEQDVGSVAEKFLQATAKLVTQMKKRPKEFGSNVALTSYIDNHKSQHFPGLGENKRRQIVHHISLVTELLT